MRLTPAIAAVLAGGVALALSVPSCSGRRVTESDIQGIWVPDRESQQYVDPVARSQCRIEFLSDGTVKAATPPLYGPIHRDRPVKLDIRKGDWSLVQRGRGNSVELHLVAVGEKMELYFPLEVESKGDDLVMFFYLNDPDSGDRFVFEREN
jgi:hypothetical protein